MARDFMADQKIEVFRIFLKRCAINTLNNKKLQ
jgi:hypothetical protein